MTEEIPSTPGWVDSRLDIVPAKLRAAYAECLGRSKQPGAPSDLLGAEFEPCRAPLKAALSAEDWAALLPKLEALEAEIAADS